MNDSRSKLLRAQWEMPNIFLRQNINPRFLLKWRHRHWSNASWFNLINRDICSANESKVVAILLKITSTALYWILLPISHSLLFCLHSFLLFQPHPEEQACTQFRARPVTPSVLVLLKSGGVQSDSPLHRSQSLQPQQCSPVPLSNLFNLVSK